MEGSNSIKVCQAQMVAIIQEWLDDKAAPLNCKVTRVEANHETDHFEIHLEEGRGI